MVYLYSFVTFLIGTVMILFLMEPWLKDQKKEKLRTIAIFTCTLFIFNVVLIGYNFEIFIRYNLFTAYLPAAIFYYKFSEFRGMRTIFTLLSAALFLTMVGTMGFFFSDIGRHILWWDMIMRIVLCILVCVFIRKMYISLYYSALQKMEHGWKLLCAISGCMFLLEYRLTVLQAFDLNNSVYKTTTAILDIIIILYYMMLIQIFQQILSQLSVKHEKQLLLAQEEVLKQQLKIEEEAQQEIRMLSHDTRHYGNAVIRLLERGDYEEAKKVAAYFVDAINRISFIQYFNLPFITSTLNYYTDLAKANQIDILIQTKIERDPEVPEKCLAAVLSNAMENAINSCRQVEKGKKEIRLECKIEDFVIIKVSNTFQENIELDSTEPSDKDKRKDRVKDIRKYVKKYGAKVKFSQKDGVEMLFVQLPQKGSEKGEPNYGD